MLKELVRKNRSYRRFYQEHEISRNEIKELIDMARLSASAANYQPLRYIISNDPATNAKIFPCLAWAGYLKDWPGPEEGEKPSAYVVLLEDTGVKHPLGWDQAIAAQTLLLGAMEKGLGGCMLGAIQKDGLREALTIQEKYEIKMVIALGKPKEDVVIDEIGPDGDIRYWRDEEGRHHVPKRKLEDIIIE